MIRNPIQRLLLLVLFLAAFPACQASPLALSVQGNLKGPYTVQHIYDGDTIQAAGERIRLVLVDTPESSINQRAADPVELELGRKAKAALAELLARSGNRVHLEVAPEARDRYGRLLAWVYTPYLQGTTPWRYRGRLYTQLNFELVRQGWAEVFVVGSANTRYLTAFNEAQEQARRLSLGIWAVYQQVERRASQLPMRIKCAVYNPPGRDDGNEEIWLEVRVDRLDLSGWAVGDDDGLKLPLSGTATRGTYVVRLRGGPHLSNKGDTILLWRQGQVVDRFRYQGGSERACR